LLGYELRLLALIERKKLLRSAFPGERVLRYGRIMSRSHGEEFYAHSPG